MFKQNIKKIGFLFFSFLLLACFLPANVNATNITPSSGLDTTASQGTNMNQLKTMDDPKKILGGLLGKALAFVGVLFFLLMIYGGFKYMISMGNEQEIKDAKALIKYAIIGLIVILSAYAITSFIGTSLTT